MAYGITDDGFNSKPLDTIKTEVEDSLKSNIDPSLNTTATSVVGQIVGILSDKLRELWNVAEAVTSSFNPDEATGASLDELSALTGTIRNAATKSTVTATLNLNNGVTVPAGSIVAVSGNSSSRFVTLANVTNSTGSTANVSAAMQAESTGATIANAGTLTIIETPVSGWNSVTNALDAVLGAAEETDSELRIRRDVELRAAGAGAVDAIRADILDVADVEYVTMYENTTLTTDGDGLPGKSFEALVLGGLNASVADVIWNSKPAGIESHGSITVAVTDDSGISRDIKFTRPTELDLYIDVTLTTEAGYAGDTEIKTVVATYCDANFTVGDDFIVSQLYNPILDVSGVYDVTDVKVYDATSLGSESLSEVGFATHANWDTTGDFDDTGGDAAYTHSTGVGTLTQTSANLAIAVTADRWYQFDYTVSGVSGDPAATITTGVADAAVTLDLTAGAKSVIFHSNASTGDFVISATSTSGGFTIDDVSLKVLNTASGNYTIALRELGLADTSRIAVMSS